MRMYFTYGTDKDFPFGIEDYVVVNGNSVEEIIDKYRKKYPDTHDNCVNCAFYYIEEEFEKIRNKYYAGVEPADIIA